MRTTSIALLGLALVATGGCASSRSAQAQDVERLRNDLNLVHERIDQLERVALNQQTPASWPMESESIAAPSGGIAVGGRGAGVKPSKKEIQQALKQAGFYQGNVDGKVGAQTKDAIKEFQRTNGLKADGVVGSHTWEKLAPYLEMASTGTAAPATDAGAGATVPSDSFVK